MPESLGGEQFVTLNKYVLTAEDSQRRHPTEPPVPVSSDRGDSYVITKSSNSEQYVEETGTLGGPQTSTLLAAAFVMRISTPRRPDNERARSSAIVKGQGQLWQTGAVLLMLGGRREPKMLARQCTQVSEFCGDGGRWR